MGGNVQKILRKGALVFLHLEIVLVLGKILGHGDEFIADLVPPFESFVGAGAHSSRSLILCLRLTARNRYSDGDQSDRK